MEETSSGKGTNGNGKGKRKIAAHKIDDEKSLEAAFCKRRKRLVEKAEELSAAPCGVDAAVTAFSPTGKPFALGDVAWAMDRHLPTPLPDDANVGGDRKMVEVEDRAGVDRGLLRDGGRSEELPSMVGDGELEGQMLENPTEDAAMMGDDEVDRLLKNLADGGAWADSSFAA